MSYVLSGKLIEKFDTEQKTESFRTRIFVVEKTPDSPHVQFSDLIKFQLTQDRCGLLDNYEVNDDITVHFNIRGRKWDRNDGTVIYMTNLDAWRLEKVGAGTASVPTQQQASSPPPPPPPPVQSQPQATQSHTEDGSDDLPF